MTAIFYPDCHTISPSGRFTLEARSPHNGTITHRDGRPASDDEFGFKYREHQNAFRYRLLSANGSVAWERFQGLGEDSPHEVLVSEGIWSIIRTHGFRPEVIAVDPIGRDVMRIRVRGDAAEHNDEATTPTFDWSTSSMSFTTAGLYWISHSWRYFFEYEGRPYFAWRASAGERLVLDFAGGRLVPEREQERTLLGRALVAEETRGVTELLVGLSPVMAEVRAVLTIPRRKDEDEEVKPHPLAEKVRHVTAAFHLVGVHRIADCIPHLREWESIDCPSYSMSSIAMGRDWWVQV